MVKNTFIMRHRLTIVIALPLLTGVIGGLLFNLLLSGFVNSNQSQAVEEPPSILVGAALIPPPQSFQELLKNSKVVVVGTVSKVVRQVNMPSGGYDPTATARNRPRVSPKFGTLEPEPRVPVTDFEISVETTLLDDGLTASGKSLILRAAGFPDPQKFTSRGEYPQTFVGDRYLFILTKNPDNTYGLQYGPPSRLKLDGSFITYSDGLQTQPSFAKNMTPATFLRQLKTTISSRP